MVAASPPLTTVTPADERRAGEGATGGIPVGTPVSLDRRVACTESLQSDQKRVYGCCVGLATLEVMRKSAGGTVLGAGGKGRGTPCAFPGVFLMRRL